jgi:hypothetical protein
MVPLFSAPRVGPSVTVLARSTLAPAVALTRVADIPLPELFVRWGVFPAVDKVREQTGRWDHVGATRRLVLGDGGEAQETLLEYTPGVGFAYEVTGFTDVFDRFVVGTRGEWTFTPDGTGTIVHWTWEFRTRFGRGPIVALLVGPLWRQYMRKMIRTAVRTAELG